MYRIIISFTFVILSLLSSLPMHGDDNTVEEVKLHKNNDNPNDHPKYPEYISIKCYFDGENITIYADEPLIGNVLLTDQASIVLYNTTTTLYPFYRFNIGKIYSDITIQIIINDIIYVGYINVS